jgi:hypothetical protein
MRGRVGPRLRRAVPVFHSFGNRVKSVPHPHNPCSILAAALLVALPATAAPRVFGGKVYEVDVAHHRFVMQGGGSKRFPRVTVLFDAKTKWSGLPRKSHLRPAENVRVEVLPVQGQGATFRALTVFIQPPQPIPSKRGRQSIGG